VERIVSRLEILLLTTLVFLSGTATDVAAQKEKKRADPESDPYAEFVWPPPPDEPRIKLETVLTGRVDVEAQSRWKKFLMGATPQTPYDRLEKPFAVAFDGSGRIVVTDWGTAALIRFDLDNRAVDVLGTRGALRLKQPLGLDIAADDTLFVADQLLKNVIAFSPEGKVEGVYGRTGELANPTDVAVSPDGESLYVADSKGHRIVVFDRASGEVRISFGQRGTGEAEFAFPTSLTFGPEGNLFVVDQINSRVQVLAPDGEYLDEFGRLGVGFANFVRPKDIAVDEVGFIYVTDNAFNNVQLFDADFTLLTFVGDGGFGPGQFNGASGIAVRGDRFAVVDQLGQRLQIFKFIVPKGKPAAPVRVAARQEEVPALSPPEETKPPEPASPPAPTPRTPTPSKWDAQQREPVVSEPTEKAAPEPSPAIAAVARPAETGAPADEEQAVSEPPIPEPTGAPSILATVEAWSRAWSEQNVEDYLRFYSSGFRPPDGLSAEAWRTQRRSRLSRPRFIEVAIEAVTEEFEGPDQARTTFVQTYRSDLFRERVRKSLVLRLEEGEWRILQERVEQILE
jgi:DNA-binding beta-propeller fold protein YncE